MELKIDADRVKAVAATCPDAKRVLVLLFPEAFPKPDDRMLRFTPESGGITGRHSNGGFGARLEWRAAGSLAGKGIYLNFNYNWKIVRDSEGTEVLTATAKD